MIFLVMNTLYFGTILIASLLLQFYHPFPLELSKHDYVLDRRADGVGLVFLVADIFFFNLFLSAFLFITLSGVAFFVLPVFSLLVRGTLWGLLLNQQPTSMFLASLPTLVLEGEGYVIASVSGIILGLSWLKPKWVFRGKEFSRSEGLKAALKESAYLYFFVATLLLTAAIVEAATIIWLMPTF